MPPRLEAICRTFLVTPALHLIHHSPNFAETNSNFGFSTIIWDRIFGTFRAASASDKPKIGLEYARHAADQTLTALLINPMKPQP
ncbi:MAG: hypothetical protein HC777_00135 [Hyphomonadaceae bacterium]|nr:hypothetical protein [Hyphomonadaceae bacterium]